jgi:hypothetical protein
MRCHAKFHGERGSVIITTRNKNAVFELASCAILSEYGSRVPGEAWQLAPEEEA